MYDFRDFRDCVKEAKCEPVEMAIGDFADWVSGMSQYSLNKMGQNRPYLDEIVTATFKKGTEDFSYKTSFDGPEKKVSFLKNTFDLNKNIGEARKKARGINSEKKKQIIENLVTLMPSNRQTFWKELQDEKDYKRSSQ